MSGGIQLDGSRELAVLVKENPLLGRLLGRTIDAVNRLAGNLGASPTGELPSPPPVDAITVAGTLSGNVLTATGELLHAVHTHNVPLNRNIQYITEVDTTPNFTNPHPISVSTSRSVFATLPTNDSVGSQSSYYLRVTPQYFGGKPGRPTVYGGLQGPTAIKFSGTTNTTLLPSQSAGTAKPGQGGQGLGAVRSRGPVGGPKRAF
jgi:hypothetical protein